MMCEFAVVEKNNQLAIHCVTWSKARAELWIEQNGDSGIFDNKSLNKDSFVVVEYNPDLAD
tara:strand:- start:6399 stop:6581 length:183 start_codon:yes stop_codon:yes gene_type:complete